MFLLFHPFWILSAMLPILMLFSAALPGATFPEVAFNSD